MATTCAFEGCLEEAVGDLESDSIRVVGRVLPSSGTSLCVRHLKQKIEWRQLEAAADEAVISLDNPDQPRRPTRRR